MKIQSIKPQLTPLSTFWTEDAQTPRIPTIQRQFVWDAEDVRDLIDSIVNGYPIGAIIIWEPTTEFPSAPLVGKEGGDSYRYVLDGQQRLTALSLMMNGGWQIERGDKVIRTSAISYVPENGKFYLSEKKGIDVSLIVRAALADTDSLLKLQKDYKAVCKKVIDEVGRKIVGYQLPMYVLKTDSANDEAAYEKIAEIFTRVNSAGVKIGNLEMFLSFFAAAFPRKEKDRIIELHEALSDSFALDLEPLVRFIFSRLGVSQNQLTKITSFRRAMQNLRERYTGDTKEIGQVLSKVETAASVVLNLLGEEFGIATSQFLPSQNTLLPAKNRLTQMTMTNIAGIAASNCLQLAFSYDYMDRRIGKIVSTNSGGTNFVPQSTNYFVCDGWNLIATFNPANTIQQSFVWGVDLSRTMTKAGGIGGLLSISNSATNYFPSYDGNGNITGLINGSNDSTSALYEYGPFGELIRATGPLAKASSFRFSTKFRDDESGLVYYGSRYYNPTQGRWIGRDSAGENAGINLYLFVSNLPLTHYDTLGNVDYSQFQQLESEVRAYINKTSFSQPCTLALMVVFHGGNGIYDFAHGVHAGESFDIGNEVVDAGQAGNFLAGYAGGYAAFNGGPFSNPFAPPLLVFGGGAYYGAGDIAVSTFSSSGGGLVAGIKNYIGSLDMQWNGYVEGASDALVGQ